MALSPWYALAFVVLLIGGLGTAAFSNMQTTVILTEAPPTTRSRVMGIVTMCIGIGPLGVRAGDQRVVRTARSLRGDFHLPRPRGIEPGLGLAVQDARITADTQHRDDVTRHRPAVAERIEGRDAGAEQRRGIDSAKLVGYRSKCVGRGHHRVGITPIIGDAGNAQITAVDQPAASAGLATTAMPAKPAHTDPLPGGPADDAGTDCVDGTGNLVTRNPGEGKAWPLTFHGQAEGQLLEGAELEGRLDAIASGTDLTFGTLL